MINSFKNDVLNINIELDTFVYSIFVNYNLVVLKRLRFLVKFNSIEIKWSKMKSNNLLIMADTKIFCTKLSESSREHMIMPILHANFLYKLPSYNGVHDKNWF
jgi:hypothetical protein